MAKNSGFYFFLSPGRFLFILMAEEQYLLCQLSKGKTSHSKWKTVIKLSLIAGDEKRQQVSSSGVLPEDKSRKERRNDEGMFINLSKSGSTDGNNSNVDSLFRENKNEYAETKERRILQFKVKELLYSSLSENDFDRLVSFFNSSPVDISKDSTVKENAGEIYKRIGNVTNIETGDEVLFVNNALGKIERHKGYNPRLIGKIEELFRNASFLFDEKPDYDTPFSDGTVHKQKKNIVGYSNYGSKVMIDEEVYLVRYTTKEPNARKKVPKQLHSQQITLIKISTQPIRSTLSLWGMVEDASDCKLASLLNLAKKYVTVLEQAEGGCIKGKKENANARMMHENTSRKIKAGLNKKINQPSMRPHQLPSVLPFSVDSTLLLSAKPEEVNRLKPLDKKEDKRK